MIVNSLINYWPVEEEKLRSLPENECFVCMFSGGKDSALALALAIKTGNLHELLHCTDMDTQQSVWHLQSLEVVKNQAEAISSRLKIITYSAWEGRTKLVKLYQHYVTQGVKSIVFGDLYEEKQAKLQVALCLSAGLIPRMPLWRRPFEELLNLLEVHQICSIITCLESEKIDSKWLGKKFDRSMYEYFRKLGIDPFGEQGEFHTTLVNADYFKKPLLYKIGDLDIFPNNKRIIHIRKP